MAKILIVDDNRFFRRMLCERFDREAEFQVCGEAENGKEAVEKALKLNPDLIVLDLLMPVMNGLDAARVLRLLRPRLPLIMNSAASDPLTERQARTIGVADIAPKSAEVLIREAHKALYSAEHVAA
jgi:DNA-binding NarL/FixJ family response regulator